MTTVVWEMVSVVGRWYAECKGMHVGLLLRGRVHVHWTRDRMGRTGVIGEIVELDVSIYVWLVCRVFRRVAVVAGKVVLPASGCSCKLGELPVDVLITQHPHKTPVSRWAYGAT